MSVVLLSLPGELNIQSIPSEVELVTEKNGVKVHQGQGKLRFTITLHTIVIMKVIAGSSSDNILSVQPDQGGTKLWKRIQHTVVFGSKVAKQKKSKN